MHAAAIRFMRGASLALTMMLAAAAARADTYPSRPITVVVPFAGGSASDVVTRILLQRMSASMGQPIIVENRPGAGGNTGTAAVAKATPDGYTIVGSGSGPIAANKTLYRDLGYDPEKDLEAISPFALFTIVITASTKLPVKTLPDVPTTAEAGLPSYEASGWFAMLAPRGTPKDIVEKLNKELAAAIAEPKVRRLFEQQGAEPVALPTPQAVKFFADETAKWHDIITKAGIPQIQ